LEVVAASSVVGRREDRPWVEASVRSVAVELGVSKNAAHRALLVLRQAGLIVGAQGRGAAGRFDVGRFGVAVPTEILEPLPDVESIHRAPEPAESAACSKAFPSRRRGRPRQIEQLVLLPSD
jgi:hypothetical protein